MSTEYSKNDFFIQTTDVDRTHMSAQTYLAGLFPPDENQEWNVNLTWQPIPIHPLDAKVTSPKIFTITVELLMALLKRV